MGPRRSGGGRPDGQDTLDTRPRSCTPTVRRGCDAIGGLACASDAPISVKIAAAQSRQQLRGTEGLLVHQVSGYPMSAAAADSPRPQRARPVSAAR